MEQYKGLEEQDLKIIQIALNKLPITGAEAPMMVNLQKKSKWKWIFLKLQNLKDQKRVIL